ncbi:MAG: S8 family serine peptidase [Chthonomonas sp.]|nr:S8 family serine peptidase [Chthonomonas sp.]
MQNKPILIALAIALTYLANGRETGELVVRPKRSIICGVPMRQAAVAALGNNVKQSVGGLDLIVVRPPSNLSWQQYQTQLMSSGLFDFVLPDTYVAPCAVMNDALVSNQWHLNETSVTRAWDFTTGGGKIVAVVDSGVALNHPDLVDNLVSGYNTISGLAQSEGGIVSDVHSAGHGTRVAGIIAARGGNGIGVTGVGPNLRVMPIRVTDLATGHTTRSELLEGVAWAADHGAVSINVSYSGVEYEDVELAGEYARQQGSMLVWAAGNSNALLSDFDHENVTIVGGTDSYRMPWRDYPLGTNYGRAVDVYAPCTQIFTTSKNGGYGNAPAGTSFAAPQVAAALALMRDRFPNLSPQELETLMFRRSLALFSYWGGLSAGLSPEFGWGRINTGAAVQNWGRQYSFTALPPMYGHSEIVIAGINDYGAMVGRAKNDHTGKTEVWIASGQDVTWIPPPTGYLRLIPHRLNNRGFVAAHAESSSGQKRGVMISTYPTGYGDLFAYPVSTTNASRPDSAVYDFENAAVGWEGSSDGASGAQSSTTWYHHEYPLRSGPLEWQTQANSELRGINQAGIAVGRFQDSEVGQGLVLDVTTNQFFFVEPATGAAWLELNRIRESGWVCGTEGSPSRTLPIRFRLSPTGLQPLLVERSEVYEGRSLDVNADGDVVGASAGQAYVFWGISHGPLSSLLSGPLPTNVYSLNEATGINNVGDIVGNLTYTNGEQGAFVARKADLPIAKISIGQTGDSPVYIGSIPPSLSITVTDALGFRYGNPIIVRYDGARAIATLPVMTAPYRLYLRCNRFDIAGYDGPTYLNTLYPPLNEPPMPPDAPFLPRCGSDVEGAPALNMFAGDTDDNGEVDASDLDVVLAHFGLVDPEPGFRRWIDLDGSGEIDACDIDIVVSNFGLTKDPEPPMQSWGGSQP